MQKSPILIHVPHASTYIPPTEMKHFITKDIDGEIFRMTDLYTDELFDCGEDMLIFPVSRLVCDVERFRSNKDEPMCAKGMGAVYTRCADGTPLRNISPQKRSAILKKYYDPHHRRLTDAVNEKLRDCGQCIIIDAHSFSAGPLPYEDNPERPDFCIGTDSYHTPESLAQLCEQKLSDAGFYVLRNKPFSGAIVPLEHLNRDPCVHSIMIEVNRGLYMTSNGEKCPDFYLIKKILSALIREILRITMFGYYD